MKLENIQLRCGKVKARKRPDGRMRQLDLSKRSGVRVIAKSSTY